MFRKCLGLLVGACLLFANAVVDAQEKVSVELLSAAEINVQVGQVVPEPMRFRVRRVSDGTPLAGVTVNVFPNLSFCIPLDPNCDETPPELYGTFETSPPEGGATLTTDAQGQVVAPLFRAGSVAGTYEMMAAVLDSSNGQLYSSMLDGAFVTVHQIESSSTHSLRRSQDGTGQAILLPYFSINGDHTTVMSVTNHADEAKAVRVVVAEGRNGRVALAFNVYLAARDTWSAALVADAGSPPAMPRLFTTDESCTSAEFGSQGVSLSNFAYSGSRNDGLGQEIGRVYQGQIEVIELGVLTDSAAAMAGQRNCAELRDRFAVNGTWHDDPNVDVATPTGHLSAEAQIVDVPSGVAFHVEPFAIEGFSAAPRHGRGDTDFDDARITKPTVIDNEGQFLVDRHARFPSDRPADAISYLMMAEELEGNFLLSEALGASTRFVISFPTRNAYLDNLPGGALAAGTATAAPFDTIDTSVATPYCIATTWRAISRSGELKAALEGALCNQVNVLEGVQHMDADLDSGADYFSTDSLDEGRLRITFDPEAHSLDYLGDPSGIHEGTVTGLPVLASVLIEVRNNNAQPGLLATYAIFGKVVRKVGGS